MKTRTEMKRELAKFGIKFKRGDLPSTEELKRLYAKYITKKHTKNPLYESFHGTSPVKVRKVSYEPPKSPLIKIGRLVRIEYEPEFPSKRRNTRYYHKGGDLGHKVIKSNAILATNKEGTQLYIVKEKKGKYPRFTSRGIVG